MSDTLSKEEIQSLRNMGNEAESAADEIERLRAELDRMRSTLPPLPEPDTHCWDDDTESDCWSYSAELVRSIVAAAVAMDRERIIAAIPGGCSVYPQWVCDMIRAG